MTVKDLRAVTDSYININIAYGENTITISGDDTITLEAFGAFAIKSITTIDDETIAATLKLLPVRE